MGELARLAHVSVRTLHEGAEDHLRRQHRMLRERIEHHSGLLAAIEEEVEAGEMGIALTPEEQFEIFGTDSVGGEWAAGAQQRWGGSAERAESQRRTATYTTGEWLTIKAEADGNLAGFAAALRAGLPADGTRARELTERYRRHICRWFYDCGHEMHRCLAEMYVTDARFTATYEAVAPGLAQYVRDAITANAAGGQPS